MPKIPNINCKHYGEFGQCLHKKQKKTLGIFKIECPKVSDSLYQCSLLEVAVERPNVVPTSPPKLIGKRI